MKLTIKGTSAELEARLGLPAMAPPAAAAVLCHPHPVYGGTMDNRVVYRAGKAALAAGCLALRFNFRGVGASTGSFDHGSGEKEDVRAALDLLETRFPQLPLVLIGFSFGAWVGLQVGCEDHRVEAMIGLGLPVGFYDFGFLASNPKPLLILAGSEDHLCPRDRMVDLALMLPRTSRLEWIEGADHFFGNGLERLQERITAFLAGMSLEKRPT